MSYTLLVDRQGDEERWLLERSRRVTASESAHLMGDAVPVQWRMSAEALAESKRTHSFPPSPLMLAGQFWEPPITEYLRAVTGLASYGSSALYGSDDRPWMAATPDGFVKGPGRPLDGLQSYLTVVRDMEVLRGQEALQGLLEVLAKHGWRSLLEIKNQESKRRPQWNKEAGPPAYYANQAQHQLAVLDDYSLCLLVAKVDANELYVHPIEADDLYQELLSEACRDFAEKYLSAT